MLTTILVVIITVVLMAGFIWVSNRSEKRLDAEIEQKRREQAEQAK